MVDQQMTSYLPLIDPPVYNTQPFIKAEKEALATGGCSGGVSSAVCSSRASRQQALDAMTA